MLTTNGTITHITYSPSQDVVIITCQIEEVFNFFEGQFMVLQAEIDGVKIKRSYSIYSTDQQLQDTKTISFCIKHKEGGLFSTRSTQTAQVGMQITMTGPVGRFVDDNASRHYLFVSVGSGLSPCFSIYQQLIRTTQYDKIANIFGERFLSHIPTEVLDAYSIQSDKIQNQIFLSKQPNLPIFQSPNLQSGYVQDGLEKALQFLTTNGSPLTDITVFICGLPAMCDEVSQILQDQGIPKNRLVIEKY